MTKDERRLLLIVANAISQQDDEAAKASGTKSGRSAEIGRLIHNLAQEHLAEIKREKPEG